MDWPWIVASIHWQETNLFVGKYLMKRYILFWLLVLAACSMSAGVPVQWRASATAGGILPGSVIEPWIGNRPVLGAEVAVEFLPDGRLEALQWYNNASVGLAFTALDLTNTAMLGQALATYAYLNVPFVRRRHFVFGIRPGVGLAFVTRNYYNTTTEAERFTSLHRADGSPIGNGGSGSFTNAFFNTALYMEFPIKNGFSVSLSGGWYHISNGSIRQPNSGFNMLNGSLGLTWQPAYDRYTAPETLVPKGLYDGKRWDVELSVSGGLRQAYYLDNRQGDRFFGVGAIGVSAHWRPWSIFKIGGGVDLFYDDYYRSVSREYAASAGDAFVTSFGKTLLAESNVANCFRLGLSLQPEFVLGGFTLGLHLGMYLFDPVRNLEPYKDAKSAGGNLKRPLLYAYDVFRAGDGGYMDGWLYTRVVMKYRVTRHLFVQFGVKAHMVKVEFFDAGLGIAF